MNRLYEQTMLFDFYGELLTEHQRRIYEDAVYNDFSLSEIAQEQGISRQGVHDLIRRCDKILQDYEDRLHLVERFTKTREIAREIRKLAGGDGESGTIIPGAAAGEEAAGTGAAGREAAAENGAAVRAETVMYGTESEKRLQRIRALAEELLREL